jgi:hypothetical protein
MYHLHTYFHIQFSTLTDSKWVKISSIPAAFTADSSIEGVPLLKMASLIPLFCKAFKTSRFSENAGSLAY